MTASRLVQRGCAPTQEFPLQQTLRRASAAEIAQIRAFWEQQPERVFKAAPDDTRIPVSGADPIDGTRRLALDLIAWAEGLHAASVSSQVRERVVSGAWEAPLRTPTTLSVTDGDVLLQAQAAYSGDCLHSGKPIREPFVYNRRRWTCVSFAGVEQPQAICREVVPHATDPNLNLSMLASGVDDTLTGKIVLLAGERWVITAGKLIVTTGALSVDADEEPASLPVEAAPIVAETEQAVALRVHDRALLCTAIGRYSGDLARWQLRLREPFRYEGRAWACLAYTPDSNPQQMTSVMCREVVPLVDVDPAVAMAELCTDAQDEWTGKQLRDPSGSFMWLVTSRELVITRDVPVELQTPAVQVTTDGNSGEIPHYPSEPVADQPMHGAAFVVAKGRAVQYSFFE